MPIKQTLAPVEEPISLTDAKLHLRVDSDITVDDSLISTLISAARIAAEAECRRSFITQKWDLFLDAFPRGGATGYCGFAPYDQSVPGAIQSIRQFSIRYRGKKIELPFPRLISVDAVKYFNEAGTQITLSPSLYSVDDASEPGVIAPAPGQNWPGTQDRLNSVQISFTCGYGNAAALPAGIKTWMLMRIGALYENREELSVGRNITVAPLPFVDRLLDPYRVVGF